MTASVSELEDEIAHLRDLDLRGLRARWHSVFRRKAPDHLPRHLLYRMIAYRLQAERLGDLDRDTRRFLDQVAAGTRNGDELPARPSWCGSGTASPPESADFKALILLRNVASSREISRPNQRS